MGRQNDGKNKINALQNQFTAYLLVAVRHQKCAYFNKQSQLRSHEFPVDYQSEQFVNESARNDCRESAPLMWQIEDSPLVRALERLTPRERYILFEHVLGGHSYTVLSEPLGLHYNGIATAYHRILQKLRKDLKGGKY